METERNEEEKEEGRKWRNWEAGRREEEEGEGGRKGRGIESLRRCQKFNKIIPRKGISQWPKIPNRFLREGLLLRNNITKLV